MPLRSVFWISFGLLFLSLALLACSVECSRPADVNRELKEDIDVRRTLKTAEFDAWVSREGRRAQLKKELAPAAAAQQKASTVRGDSSFASAVQTYIVVDQNGYGQFAKVQDAIDSITTDQTRTQRITIQVNPGYYKYVLNQFRSDRFLPSLVFECVFEGVQLPFLRSAVLERSISLAPK